MSSDNETTTFYDIASAPPLRTFAPNPWKTRFALNFKGIPYQTQWVQMPQIASLREGLGVLANRTLPDGSPFHTLPMIKDATTNRLIGDSFEIALYLDETYPDAPKLFHPRTIGLTAALNAQVDSLFTPFTLLCDKMPFDPSVIEEVIAIFAKRAGTGGKDIQQEVSDEQREEMLVSFEAKLGELAKAYWHTGGTTDHIWRAGGTEKEQVQRPPPGRELPGPFLDGDEPAYPDFIVGAWLKMMEASMRPEEWQRMRSWQGGLWANLVDALSEWSEIK